MLHRGARVDRYVVEALLGSGGVGTVYRVRHAVLGTSWALKVLTVLDGEPARRFLREGRMQARIDHPNVLRVHDVLDVEGRPGLIMPLVGGSSLDRLLECHRCSLEEATALLLGTCRGVEAAHAHGIVHRDLKPANVLLRLDEEGGVVPCVADFGAARDPEASAPTRAGAFLGTHAYAAPEQIRDSSAVQPSADAWALGCIAFELVTGRRAFPPHPDDDVIRAIREGRHVEPREAAPDLPDPWVELLASLIRVEPAERLEVAELRGRLEQWSDGSARPLAAGSPVAAAVAAASAARQGPAGEETEVT